MRTAIAVGVIALACAPSLAAARTLDYADLHRIIGYSNAQISPDGTRILYLRSHIDFARTDHTVV